MKFVSTFNSKLIYVFRINDEAHKDCLKIGETTYYGNEENLLPNCSELNDAAKKRINEYTQTAGIDFEILHTEKTDFRKDGKIQSFNDSEVHSVLIRSKIIPKTFNKDNQSREWFVTDLKTVKNAIKAVKEGRDSLLSNEISTGNNPIIFRPEQIDAIEKTKKQFKKSKKMLWFAKMRFGKTLSALQVVKDLNYSKTLILTHRPVVDNGWFEDFGKIFYDTNFIYGSKRNGEQVTSISDLEKKKKNYIYFASMQDLRGSSQVGGNFKKNDEIFSTNWDLIIIDEAHEGTQTELGINVLNEVSKSNTKELHLSGTPFNLLNDYKEDEIFTWDYVMEQKAKTEWDLLNWGTPNPYISLPKLNIYTFDLGKLISKYQDTVFAFNFKEFFRVNKDGNFIHEKDIISFLDLICKEDIDTSYPFSSQEFQDNFRHTLWMVPGVKEAKALSVLLQSHPVFSQFNIANVAGDGDEEKANDDALKLVKEKITDKPEDNYSITLSCGRLTTGVSVPAWTAVLMLSGSQNTSASSYMQTIFRVQTPATINGKMKEQCFVFDFAPDRTLKVIAEAIKISAKAGKTTDEDRKNIGEFLNFCPIIATPGTKMITYNAEQMIAQLKKVYIDRVVSNGFEDGYLYNNDQLMKLGELDLKEFDNLQKIIGTTKAMPKTNDIELNNLGFTDEEYEKSEIASKKSKSKKELTEEDNRLLKEREEKKKQRDTAVSILRGISIRMPLLLYGADVSNEDEEITIDNFTNLVDDTSWAEFMPKGVTKEEFIKFKKYYESDIFREAGKKIRAMARATDNLRVEERIARITSIFNSFRNPDKETVLTPWRVVNMHLGDCLGGYVFLDEEKKVIEKPTFKDNGEVTNNVFDSNSLVLEINSKSGLYPLYMAFGIFNSKIKALNTFDDATIEEELTIWNKVIKDNIYVICKTPMAVSITKRTLAGFGKTKVNAQYIPDLVNEIANNAEDFIKHIKQGKSFWKSNNNDNMKFNVVVGNPPYQEVTGNETAQAVPIYHKFIQIGKKINPRYISMISPARWYAGGMGLSAFRQEMLNDNSINKLFDYPNAKDCFPNIELRGGICYFLRDELYSDTCDYTNISNNKVSQSKRDLSEFSVFIRWNQAVNIIKEMKLYNFVSLSTIVSSVSPFGLNTSIRGENEYSKDKLKMHSSDGISYIDKNIIDNSNDLINSYKVLISRPISGNLEIPPVKIIALLKVLEPNEVCTHTYLVAGNFKTKKEALNLYFYLQSKFARFLLFQSLSSMDLSQEKFMFVPLQDFTENSDIDWSKSVAEIDQQLYKKYNLEDEEIKFIESMIKPME